MNIRNISNKELHKYTSLSKNDNCNFKNELLKWLGDGRTKIDHCFVVEENDEFLGRIVYGLFKDEPNDLKIWNITLRDGNFDAISIYNKLIRESMNKMKLENFKTIEYNLYSDGNDSFEIYKEIFLRCGFEIVQEKSSFICDEFNRENLSSVLNFKSLREVGENKFLKAIERVTENTLDQDDINCINEYGSKEASRKYFNILKTIDFNEDWWNLAYENEGEFVGLVVPQQFNKNIGAINYIGVTPEKRGKGYVNELLWHGTKVLFNNAVKEIIADIDVKNFPMEKSLYNQSYKFKNKMAVLKITL